MLIKVDTLFPLRTSEIHKIYRALDECVSEIEIEPHPVNKYPRSLHCELITDNWMILIYPRDNPPPVAEILGSSVRNSWPPMPLHCPIVSYRNDFF